MEDIEVQANNTQVIRKGRGGARPGAGRKRIYESRYDFKRLKCKASIAPFVNTCIHILDTFSENDLFHIFSKKMDGTQTEYKGAGLRHWDDNNSFSSSWSIRINEEYDYRIFALAFLLINPRYVAFEGFDHEQKVWLRWQRIDEIATLMMNYGNIMARRNRLKPPEQDLLNEIPNDPYEILEYISEKLSY